MAEPVDGVLEPVIAPQNLAVYDECRRPEHAQRCRVLRCLLITPFDRFAARLFDDRLGMLPGLAQAVREIGLQPRFLAVLKPSAIGRPNVDRKSTRLNSSHG